MTNQAIRQYILFLLALLWLPAWAQPVPPSEKAEKAQTSLSLPSIAAARRIESFSCLLEAVQAIEVAELLVGSQPGSAASSRETVPEEYLPLTGEQAGLIALWVDECLATKRSSWKEKILAGLATQQRYCQIEESE